MLPTSVGDLLFRFTAPGEKLLVVLRNGMVLVGRRRSAAARKALLRVKEILGRLLEDRGARRWLAPRNGGLIKVPVTKAGLAALLGGVVTPREPFWGSWFLGRIVEPRGARAGRELRIVLKNGSGTGIELLFAPEGIERKDGNYLIDHELARLFISSDGRSGDDRDSALNRPEAAFGYLLSKGLHGRIEWLRAGVETKGAGRGRARRSERAAPARPEPGLIDHCLRSYGTGQGRPSRYFNYWGDIDQFCVSAASHIFKDASIVLHSNRECEFTDGILSKNLAGPSSHWLLGPPMKTVDFEHVFVTDVHDAAIVHGGEGLLEDAIEQSKRLEPKNDIVVIGHCDYHMVGDDIGSVCKKCAPARARIKYLNPPLAGFEEVKTSNWWRDFLTCLPRGKRSARKGAVNLAGLGSHDEAHISELKGLLERVGIETASVILPYISPDAYARFAQADLTVLSAWHPIGRVLEAPLREQGFKSVKLDCPYGVAGTAKWLAAVASRLGLKGVRESVVSGWADELAPGYGALKERARRVTIGLVADIGTLAELCSPGFFFGLDPCSFFTDLGFNLKVFQVTPAGRSRAVPERLLRAYPCVEFHMVDRSLSPKGLIKKHGLDLVYCDICQGEMIKRAGATPFGADSLRMGLSGARQTQAKLLALSGITLHSEFGRFLRDA